MADCQTFYSTEYYTATVNSQRVITSTYTDPGLPITINSTLGNLLTSLFPGQVHTTIITSNVQSTSVGSSVIAVSSSCSTSPTTTSPSTSPTSTPITSAAPTTSPIPIVVATTTSSSVIVVASPSSSSTLPDATSSAAAVTTTPAVILTPGTSSGGQLTSTRIASTSFSTTIVIVTAGDGSMSTSTSIIGSLVPVSDTSSGGSTSTGTIVGAVIGSLVGLIVLAGLIFFACARRRRQRAGPNNGDVFTDQMWEPGAHKEVGTADDDEEEFADGTAIGTVDGSHARHASMSSSGLMHTPIGQYSAGDYYSADTHYNAGQQYSQVSHGRNMSESSASGNLQDPRASMRASVMSQQPQYYSSYDAPLPTHAHRQSMHGIIEDSPRRTLSTRSVDYARSSFDRPERELPPAIVTTSDSGHGQSRPVNPRRMSSKTSLRRYGHINTLAEEDEAASLTRAREELEVPLATPHLETDSLHDGSSANTSSAPATPYDAQAQANDPRFWRNSALIAAPGQQNGGKPGDPALAGIVSQWEQAGFIS
ncbi:uncharacterized protein L969DRAFT_89753 [Mixia osmundae IAM 14324]|uniref:Mid2 domain-containing protein n=1 Tax=Mixia osmundae (strain CBS 9802 / IAM 14324 / JCM 22182 / KY 12970) TaxID=764103 RepID=G7E509_MIXOS|nr:uncharacterized protein L969DRAFT_89753 [Mixia osmundae IAM 14324]KEI37779.1 hypothetical protein L969DRAFT_89753 [Mixia osmundae IAM 14324]GAA97919.1 hypothetical protein E5Q_04599 [Mixia osmundae IAM 14324]